MLIKNEFEVAAPVEKVWQLFENIPQVAACLPGAELTEDLGDDTYKGKVAVRMGPARLQFAGTANITERDEAAKRVVVHVSGADEKGRGQASMVLTATLDRTGRGTTKVGVVQDLQLSGAAAQYGRGMITDVTTVLMRDFAANLQGRIERRNLCESAEPAAAAPAKGFSLGTRAALTALSRVLLRGAHDRASRHHPTPRAADRARPGQPHRGRHCRHAVVGLVARRPDRRAPRAAPHHAADRPRRRPRRHRRTGHPPHDQHRDHWRDLRHRRRPAPHRRMSVGYRAQGDAQLANSDRGLASIAGITATRVA